MTTENREERQDKVTHRTMGEYSIAKSFKGILRISHIMELIDGEPDYFLSPTYYGTPKRLMNISGGTYASKEVGYQTAIKAMQKGGGIERYEENNIRIGNDPLKLNRVPMTDSMGNYLNWNIGLDGITIGSNEDINGNELSITSFKQFQGEKDFIVYQEKIFPVVQTRDLTVGLENKMISSNKKGINNCTLSIESGTHDAMLITENMYDVSPENRENITRYRLQSTGSETEAVNTSIFKNLINGQDAKYSKLRTIYKNTKNYPEDYDAFMFRQNDFDVDNYHREVTLPSHVYDGSNHNETVCDTIKEGKPVRDSIVDVVNLKDYVKSIILKYMKGNVIEVPSGAVIWQYCSLEKWRAHGEGSLGNGTVVGEGAYPGHRPPLQIRESQAGNIFSASTIQGVCRKINRLKKTSNGYQEKKETNDNPEIEDTTSMHQEEDSGALREIIPLYKRDYVLCDGSKYRIPYSAPLQKATMTPFMEHQNRFFELFFNIGYRYTERKNLQVRCKSMWDAEKNIYIPIDRGNTNLKVPISEKNVTNSSLNEEWFNNLDKLPETPPYSSWYNLKNASKGFGYPYMIPPSSSLYDNCNDLDVLFQEDLATMLACNLIYEEYNAPKRLNGKEWNFDNIKEWLMNQPLPEEYIFNTFVGDLQENVHEFFNNSNENDKWFTGYQSDGSLTFDHKEPRVMDMLYRYCPNGEKPILPLGREVTYFGSPMKFYSTEETKFVITSAANLPMVNFFIYLMTSNHRLDGSLQMYFYSFYNYDFQVPNFFHESQTPVMIGSGAFCENDDERYKVKKVQSWTSNFSEGDYPHRHGIFLYKGGASNAQLPGRPNDDWDNQSYTNLPTLTGQKPASAIAYIGGVVTNLNAAGKHGGTLQNHDGNGNYIINPIPLTFEDVRGTSYAPYKVIQSDEENAKWIGWQTGLGYINESSEMVNDNPDKYEHFTESDGNLSVNFIKNIKHDYSFTLKDDPRFQTAEPNRGLTSKPFYIDATKVTKYKSEDAAEIFHGTTDINWFTPENIQMLPLIKL